MRHAPLLLAAAIALTACSQPAAEKPAGVTQGAVITFATFARILDDDKGIAEGLNLDGRVHPMGDYGSCGMKDYTSPEGDPGIDNQFGALLPVIEAKVGTENIGQLLDSAIADGQLLILMAIDDLTDEKNDAAVTVRIAAGMGTPLLDTQGKFIAYQTFGIDTKTAPVSKVPARVKDGVLLIGPGDAQIPVRVLDARFNLALHGMQGKLTITPDPDGGGVRLAGTIGGGIQTADFTDIVTKLNIGQDVIGQATTLVGLVADQARSDDDGKCKQVSAALKVETTPAFILE